MKLESINRFKGKYILVNYQYEGKLLSSIGVLEHVQKNKITIYREKPTMTLESIDINQIVTLSELEDIMLVQVPHHKKRRKKRTVKRKPVSLQEHEGNITIIDGGSRWYYPGCNPPKKWLENHPYSVTCYQCKKTFIDRAFYIDHFEKKGSTCRLES